MTPSRRICFITHTGYPVEPRCRRMAEALTAAGYEVDILCLQLAGQTPRETVNSVTVIRLPETHRQGGGAATYLREYARFFLLAARELRRLHRARPYALVQVHNPPDALVFATLPLRLARIPVVLDLRELMPELFMSRFSLARGSRVVRLLTGLEWLSCRYASAVLVLHDRHERIMEARGLPKAKMTQVMNTPDERLFDPNQVRRAPRPAAGPERPFVVVHQGTMVQRYGVDVIARAVALARPQIPCLRLEFYGTGDFQPAMERLVAELGIGDITVFHGYRPLDEMPQAVANADVGVAALRKDVFTDCGLPTKLLEYIQLGVPAIASRTATTADYFDERSVLLFESGSAEDLADKLLDVYCDPESAQARVAQARQFTATRNWRSESAAYIQLIARLVR